MSTSRLDNKEGVVWVERTLQAVVAAISAGAAERDARPSFPEDAFRRLALSGVLAIPSPEPVGELGRRSSFAEEWCVLRAVARADGSNRPHPRRALQRGGAPLACRTRAPTLWVATRGAIPLFPKGS